MRLPAEQVSTQYAVRPLTEGDLPAMLALCEGNPVYYAHMHTRPTLESLRETLTALPPKKTPEDKYFLGYFQNGQLIAILDLIACYPDSETAFIGWFILEKRVQGGGVGTAIIRELLAFLKAQGFLYVRLGYIKGNPQSGHFWHKNHFLPTGLETQTDSYTVVVMQRELSRPSSD